VGCSSQALLKLAGSHQARESVEALCRAPHLLEALGLEGLLPRLQATLGRIFAGGS
jgi:uncharacterized membrane protein